MKDGRRVRTLAVVAAVASPTAGGALAVAALSSATLIAPHLRAAHPAPHAHTADGHRVAGGGELGRTGLVARASIAAIEPAHEKVKVLVQTTEEIFCARLLGARYRTRWCSQRRYSCLSAETVCQATGARCLWKTDRFCTHPTGHALPNSGRRAGCRCRALLAATLRQTAARVAAAGGRAVASAPTIHHHRHRVDAFQAGPAARLHVGRHHPTAAGAGGREGDTLLRAVPLHRRWAAEA